ncbi:MAG: EF-P lysine aminoacylase EpmA, partial [Candidatus Sedimenticola sp. (ex Thyasira tokunagai)]
MLLADIRAFFLLAGVLEVDTPSCSRCGVTDPALESFKTRYTGPGAASGADLYLHTSPEFPMKRLLAAGSGAIYQICKVFRDGEAGRYHNPEFTLLEWYRPGFDHHQLMDEMEQLIQGLLPSALPVRRISYGDLFRQHLDIDPFSATVEQLRNCAQQLQGVESLNLTDTDSWLDLLLTHLIEPELGEGLCFVYDYPASQASLARLSSDDPRIAERFELYINGVEMANGFHELTDENEQRQRFQLDQEKRQQLDLPLVPMDEQLLHALGAGLPDCSGVALGIDRLLMHIVGAEHIDQVIAFPLDRA